MMGKRTADRPQPWPAILADIPARCGYCHALLVVGDLYVAVGRWGGSAFMAHESCRRNGS